ncbi:MAG: hypothetical protein BWY52_01832 [Chloroflexi bacterium ADurb.Bin325]|nr:MAG: hypothetical protein BWY52_01832 [Chloroflexi bacterium ADurb.Bin325]
MQFLTRYITIPQYLRHQTRADRFTAMNGYHCRAAVRVSQKVMAALDADDFKPQFSQGAD